VDERVLIWTLPIGVLAVIYAAHRTIQVIKGYKRKADDYSMLIYSIGVVLMMIGGIAYAIF
jgi:hypothetical protein